jgi:ABC-type uncharacterized transport system involved in gliding motility auxiliary subunit
MIYKYFVAALLVVLPCADCVELTVTSLAQEDATITVSHNSECMNGEQPSESNEEASPAAELPSESNEEASPVAELPSESNEEASPVAEQPSESNEEASPVANCYDYTVPEQFYIVQTSSGLVVGTSDEGTTSGTALVLTDKASLSSQKFTQTSAGIQNPATGLMFDC